MARSMDTWVVNDVDTIIKFVETGPKIAQKYIEKPMKFQGKKFDLRFVVLLKSVLPLEIYLYDEYYIRFSNNEFRMDPVSFFEYQTHFTVMNYQDGPMTNMLYPEFEKKVGEEYGPEIWPKAFEKIKKTIAKVFIAF